jgi:hypothetical protein
MKIDHASGAIAGHHKAFSLAGEMPKAGMGAFALHPPLEGKESAAPKAVIASASEAIQFFLCLTSGLLALAMTVQSVGWVERFANPSSF